MSSRFLNDPPPGTALHVVRRGRRQAQCFFDEHDRQAFLAGLCTFATRFECAIHAYVLMGNHVHLLLTASKAGGTARLMDEVCRHHEQSFDAAQASPGAVWAENFEASPIHVRKHFLACMRYIELNPVRAQLVSRPGAFRWSSHAANALGQQDALVTPHPFYYALGRSDTERRRVYRRLFDSNPMQPGQIPGGPHTGPRGPSRPT